MSSTSVPITRVGKYSILAHIGVGGMANVYRARDEDLGRIVALKVLTPDLARNPVLLTRFRREARAASRLVHKNIVTLYEFGEADGLFYLAMEYIEGYDLSEYIRRKGQLDPEEARRLLIQACKALEHAASLGIVHRDIKPANFLLANDEGRCRVKLTDMGLSRMENEEDFRVTRDGTTVGTVDYMAPEQARDSSLADIRSDIYSLGCTFYQMLAGKPPFSDGGLAERIYKHIASDPPDVRDLNPKVPAALWQVLRKMLAKHPDDRYQTPTELIQALRDAVKPTPGDPEVDLPADVPEADGPAVRPPSSSDLTPAPRPGPDATRPIRRRKRRTTVADVQTSADESSATLPITPEQRQAAAGQFAHATEVVRSGGDLTYAQQLLLSCCKLEPANVLYRKTLREVGRDLARTKKGSWFGSLGNLPARRRMRSARNAGDHLKVLECGEELLGRNPDDAGVQLEMAGSAEALGLQGLAVWLLEDASGQENSDVAALRALGELLERQRQFSRAIATWERVLKVVPGDVIAKSKIKDLAASDTIARTNLRR